MSQIYIALTGTNPATPSTTSTGQLDGTLLGISAITSREQSQGMAGIEAIRVEASIQGVTGGTLDVILEMSINNGVTWTEFIHWTQLLAGGAAKRWTSSHSIYNASAIADTGVALGANASRDGVFGPAFRMKTITGAGVSQGLLQKIEIYGCGA